MGYLPSTVEVRSCARPLQVATTPLGLTQCAPVRDGQGRVIAGVLAATDITEQRRAEEAIRENDATIRALLETASQGIIGIDPKGFIRIVIRRPNRLSATRAASCSVTRSRTFSRSTCGGAIAASARSTRLLPANGVWEESSRCFLPSGKTGASFPSRSA